MTSLHKQQHPAFVLLGYFWHSEMSFLPEKKNKKTGRLSGKDLKKKSEREGLQNVQSIISAC